MKVEKLKLVELEGDEAVEAMMRMGDPEVCPACGARKPDPNAKKAFSGKDLAIIGLFFAAVTLFGVLGFGGNFFLAVFAGLISFAGTQFLAVAVDKRLGLK